MRRRGCLLVLVVALLWCGPSAAAEKSDALVARGLVEMAAGRVADALRLFDEALQLDPASTEALYQRSLARSRLGDTSGAIADLRLVLQAKPDFDQAALDLGALLVDQGSYEEAIPLLERAQKNERTSAHASLFLGIAQVRLGRSEPAIQNVRRAAAENPELELAATYYEAVAHHREQRWDNAREDFERVAAESPNTEMGRQSVLFLRSIDQQVLDERGWEIRGGLGFEYDSNVSITPDDELIQDQLDVSDQADGRVTVAAGGTYRPWRNERARLLAGYDFYQSFHFDLTEFNIQQHSPSLDYLADFDWVRLGMLGRYGYYRRDDISFLQEGMGLPWVSFPEGDIAETNVYFRLRGRDFLENEFDLRDAWNYAGGVRQFMHFGAPYRFAFAGYRLQKEDPTRSIGDLYANEGQQVEIGGGWSFPGILRAEAGYAYRNERYANASRVDGGPRRVDKVHEINVGLHRRLTEQLELTAAYYGTLNDSNQDAFQYDRHIGSIVLETRF